MNIYQVIAIVLGLGAFLPLATAILRGAATQNLATFVLWGILDFTNGASMFFQGSGNYQLPFAYSLGAVIICACILTKQKGSWTSFETFISFLVAISWAGWFLSGPYYANVFASVGMSLATLPQLKDAWKKPEDSPLGVYLVFFIANVLSTYGGSAWSVEERLYPFACAILCGAIILATLKRYFRSGFERVSH